MSAVIAFIVFVGAHGALPFESGSTAAVPRSRATSERAPTTRMRQEPLKGGSSGRGRTGSDWLSPG